MSLFALTSSLAASTATLASASGLPETFNNLMHNTLALSDAEMRLRSHSPDTSEFVKLAGHVAANLQALPTDLVDMEEISALEALITAVRGGKTAKIEDIIEDIEDTGVRVAVITGKLFRHRTLALSANMSEGAVHKFPDPDIKYECYYKGKIIQPDPEGLNMDNYRLAEESAWIYLLGEPRDIRVYLGPSVWGAGQATHMWPHIKRQLIYRGLHVERITMRAAEDQNGLSQNYLQSVIRPDQQDPAKKTGCRVD